MSVRSGFTLDDLTVNGLGGDAVGPGYGSTVNIDDSTITNSAEAIDSVGPVADTTIMDTTISGNTVGIDSFDGSSGINLTEDTIAGNTDGIEGAFEGLSVAGTIVADNSGGDCISTSGSLTDNGYNDNGDGSCGFIPTVHSFTHTNPDLGTLEDHGGPTNTQDRRPPAPSSARSRWGRWVTASPCAPVSINGGWPGLRVRPVTWGRWRTTPLRSAACSPRRASPPCTRR
jgi:hypothetical protein